MAEFQLMWLCMLMVWICTSSVYAQHQPLPNCNSSCGGVNMLYPFGWGSGCFRDLGFEISCVYRSETSTFTPLLRWESWEIEVQEITHDQVRVRGLVFPYCFNVSGGWKGETVFNLSKSPFTFSHTENTFTGFGCDVFAFISQRGEYMLVPGERGYITVPGERGEYITGCVSLCPTGVSSSESCSGIGCCQTTIPKGLKALQFNVNNINTTRQSWGIDLNGCSYAALMDRSFMNSYHFGVYNVTSPSQMMDGIMELTKSGRTLLDWAIGEETCREAEMNSTSFACQDKNSYCVDSTNGHGYRCNCSKGYRGNPYLQNGCHDIDECKGPNNCINRAACVNLPGSYDCICPDDARGDGRRDGDGCMFDGNKTTRIIVVVIGVAVGLGVLGLLAIGFWLYKEAKKRKHMKLKAEFFKQNGGLLLEQQVSSGKSNLENTKIFATEELERATDNFNHSRILGSGGFGTVYKGMLSDGRIVAIKKSKKVDKSQIEQFINELVILSRINHRNVVRVLGCCLETQVPLLVYEFVSSGTLSHHLHDENHKASISWECRFRIAIEIAEALSYLHSLASTPIFHRDIKSCNILLDESYRAKVCDFGISRSIPYEKSHLTTRVQGTFGYLDPEYFHSSQFTEKSDVYSFGVVLVELLTGKKPVSFDSSDEVQNTVMCFRSSMKENRVLEMIETRVQNEGGQDELLAVAKIAKRCVELVGRKRPTMKEVVIELEGVRKVQVELCVAQNSEDSKNWLHYCSSVCTSDPESEDTGAVCQSGSQELRHGNSLLDLMISSV